MQLKPTYFQFQQHNAALNIRYVINIQVEDAKA